MTNQPKAEKNIFKEQIQTTICSGSRFQMKSVIYVGKVVAHSKSVGQNSDFLKNLNQFHQNCTD